MIDVVYSFRLDKFTGSKQLIYSLRSLETHAKNVRNVYIIGAEPVGIHNIIHIPATDNLTAATNIRNKLLLAATEPGITDEFLYTGDDHYFIKPVDALTYPYYTNGTLEELMATQKSGYKLNINETIKVLGPGAKNFNIHCPIRYNKSKLIEVFDSVAWTPMGMLAKSLYGNILNLSEGKELKDCKIRHNYEIHEMLNRIGTARDCFSTGKEHENPNIGHLLAALYPKPSKYEKTSA